MLATRASDSMAIVVHNNLVGGQDELVFDGNSLIINEKGEVIARGKQFEEDFVVADLDVESVFRSQLHDPRRGKKRLGQRRNYRSYQDRGVKRVSAIASLLCRQDELKG